jgi:hypothetical protein
MALYKLDNNKKSLVPVPISSFLSVDILEKPHLQPLLRDNLNSIAPDLFLISESFSGWNDSSREVDLLALDAEGNLVVIEIKRTDDAGHAELQAIRYAAMLSSFDFDSVVQIHETFLEKQGKDSTSARQQLEYFLGGDKSPSISNRPRILLVAAGFSREVATTVIWLNEVGLDIRCMQIQLYVLDEIPYLDIEQVIPLRSTQDYMFSMSRKSEAVAKKTSGSRREDTLKVLEDAYVLTQGTTLIFMYFFKKDKDIHVPDEMKRCTFDSAKGEGIIWDYDGERYTLTGLTKKIYFSLGGGNENFNPNGTAHWSIEGENVSLWDKKEVLLKGIVKDSVQ